MQFKNIAITGGSGGLGSYVVDQLLDKANITVIDIKPPDKKEVRFVQADILDLGTLYEALAGQDALIHLAAIPNPRTASAEVTFNTNVQGTWNVLQVAEDSGICRVAIASSDSVPGLFYDSPDWPPQYLPVDEDHPVRPTEFYSLSKHMTEVICRSYVNRGKLQIAAIRPSKIVLQHEWSELRDRGTDVHNFHFWAYVEPEDVAHGFYLALELKKLSYDVFFISADDSLCSRPTLDMVKERLGSLPEIRKPEVYERNPHASIFDSDRAKKVLGFRAKSDWRRLFKRVAADYQLEATDSKNDY